MANSQKKTDLALQSVQTKEIKGFYDSEPEKQLEMSVAVAKALKRYIDASHIRPLKINNQEHLYNQHWQFIGMQYKCATNTKFEWVEGGAKAAAEVIYIPTGQKIGGAEAYCLRAEKNWAPRDNYAIASMAQTRAASKALKNIFGWVVAMGGFAATPAEEIQENEKTFSKTDIPKTSKVISEPEMRASLLASIMENAGIANLTAADVRKVSKKMFGAEASAELSINQLRQLDNYSYDEAENAKARKTKA